MAALDPLELNGMKLTIDIPEEFEEHFNNDRFAESLERIRVDIDLREKCFCGLYEVELLKMLKKAFKEASNSETICEPTQSKSEPKIVGPCKICKHYKKGDTTCKKNKPHASIGCYKDFEIQEGK